ncbi:putative signal transduction protein with CBS domain containing protein [Desulfosarcina cetonica]|uniref:CBS domain-containing protein n=1 Tax=Desulfosarcina cetonica TaxID=90730 RepID=UPI0006CF8F91|nr:CBS domain-containing protein [Desulfosarcina cetonica]VTR64093.1 putative signal transduction protein with CBS domain containing protein [Desulfosarcina cetonica]
MPMVRTRNVLGGLRVREAMRRQQVLARADETARRGVARMIKFKSDYLLITDDQGAAAGIVTQTDMTGAYYAGLPVETTLGEMMIGPLRCCYLDDPLEDALETMGREQVGQLFVRGADAEKIEGVLTYSDILGLVYRFCRHCRKSRYRMEVEGNGAAPGGEVRVEAVMDPEVNRCDCRIDLIRLMEILTTQGMGAVLLDGSDGRPAGVVSKSDLVIAWYRGVDPTAAAMTIMSRPVQTCHRRDTLTDAIARMLFVDLGRIFVHDADPGEIVGVMSLASAARHRSGTCKACIASRLVA